MGWADHRREDGKRRAPAPGYIPGNVILTDMPAPRPVLPRPRRFKGLPGPTRGFDEDHQPGGGAWREVTP